MRDQELGLIKATLSLPISMHRDWRQNLGRVAFSDEAHKMTRQHFRPGSFTLELESVNRGLHPPLEREG